MSSSGEVYGMHILPDRFNADILLPNGLYMTIPCKREDTLENVKRQLWKAINSSTAKCFDIGDQSSFIFSAVTYDAKLEEFYEESRRLCDLRLFDLMLKLIEPEGNKEEKRFNSMIDIAIGKKVNELFIELPKDIREEVNDFRKSNTDYEESNLVQIDQGQLFSSYSSYVDVPFELKIISATYVNVRNVDSIFVRVAIYHGTECLGTQDTSPVEPTNPKWDQWLTFGLHCTELPRSAKICMAICVVSTKRTKEIYSLGSVNFSVFDYRGYMRSGRMQMNLWPPIKATEDLLFPLGGLGSCPNNESPCLLLELIGFDRHVVFAPIRDVYAYAAHASKQESLIENQKINIPPDPESLPQLLDAIDWRSRVQTSQLYVLLDDWGQVSLETALRLLDTKYEDSYVRSQAVKWIDECLDESMLSCYLLQFVQVLKTEPYLENELARFLTNRALMSTAIGNQFFWYLKSECDEINDYYNTIRFRYLLEHYLRGLSEIQLTTLVRQVQGLDKLMNLAEAMKDKTREERTRLMQSQMRRVDFCEMLQNIPDPTNHNRFLGELLFDKCRIMDSAKKPLWLVWSLPIFEDSRAEIYTFNPKSEEDIINSISSKNIRSYSYSGSKEYSIKDLKTATKSIIEEDSMSINNSNSDDTSRFSTRTMTSSSDSAIGISNLLAGKNSSACTQVTSVSNGHTTLNGLLVATSAIIFKIGDDLRQDMLTLQIIRIVEQLWKQEGLDMCMLSYTCLATGKNVGIIEVVNRAETITSIQRSGGRMATIQIDSSQLHRWIRERNHDNYDEAIRRFTRSCAGYSVLTFVLGIADRNPDNIMVSEDGRIFHIDFGHFLGHFKKKFGISRERVPFVLTDDFLQVIAKGTDARKSGSFDTFRDLCGEAYVSLRRHSNLLITLFTMMLRTGIPELREIDDLVWLKQSLQVGETEEAAKHYFQNQFFEAYRGAWATKVDWFFHNIKRMG